MIIKKLWDFISKRPQILKFHIFEMYIDFYFKSNFDAVFVFELIEPRGYCNIWTDFLCLLPFQSKVNQKGPTNTEFLNLSILILHPILNLHI